MNNNSMESIESGEAGVNQIEDGASGQQERADDEPRVKSLGYIGGQDGPVGGFCEPLVIKTDNGEHYVLHEMHTYIDDDDGGKFKARHNKVELESLEELTNAFEEVRSRLRIDRSMPWTETDASCGFNIPEEEFQQATSRSFGSNPNC